MKKVALDLRSYTIPQKVEFGRQIKISMTGNSNFISPIPTLTMLDTVCNDLEIAYNTAEQTRLMAKSKTVIQNQKETAFNDVVNQIANYVENASNGDEAKIKSAGMDVKSLPTHTHLNAPTNFVATHGDNEGEIDLHWDSIKDAKSYTIEKTSTTITQNEAAMQNEVAGPTAWLHLMVSTKSSVTVKGLMPGTRYYFKVAAVGASGQSAWSEFATKVA